MAEGIRRRKVASLDEPALGSAALEGLKHFDVYTKVHDDYIMRSQAGGVVTLWRYAMKPYLVSSISGRWTNRTLQFHVCLIQEASTKDQEENITQDGTTSVMHRGAHA
eukprot:4820846-Amphidinium_carterae.1